MRVSFSSKASLYFSMKMVLSLILLVGVLPVFTSCASQVRAKEDRLEFQYDRGKTATLRPDGTAKAPWRAPRKVKKMIEAANSLVGKPYIYGGGHRSFQDEGYDCSGAVSYVLNAGGKLESPLISENFLDYGKKGYGDWVTVYVKEGHVFLVIAGLRFDTGGTWNSTGPRWKPESRSVKSFYVRHPKGL